MRRKTGSPELERVDSGTACAVPLLHCWHCFTWNMCDNHDVAITILFDVHKFWNEIEDKHVDWGVHMSVLFAPPIADSKNDVLGRMPG